MAENQTTETEQLRVENERLRAELNRVAVNAKRIDSSPYALLIGCRMIAEKALMYGR